MGPKPSFSHVLQDSVTVSESAYGGVSWIFLSASCLSSDDADIHSKKEIFPLKRL